MRIWLQTVAPDIGRGLRAAVATIIPFYLATALDHPELRWVALGGWFGSLVDPGGSKGDRALLIGNYALFGGVSVTLTGLLLPWPELVILYLTWVAFCTSLLRALGGAAASLGTFLLIATCISMDGTYIHPLRDGLAFTLGASWAVLLSSVVWPVWTHLPLRRSVGRVFDRLGDYATELAHTAEHGTPVGHDEWSRIARQHQRTVRAAIEETKQVALALRARRFGESPTGSRLRVLLGDAEAQFFSLIAVGEEIERAQLLRGEMVQALHAFASSCRDVNARLISAASFFSKEHAERDWPVLIGPGNLENLLRSGQSTLSMISSPETSELDDPIDGNHKGRRSLLKILQVLRDALSIRSPHLHHAIRVACAVSFASFVGRWFLPQHVAWVMVTAVGVLQPFPGATAKRAIERVIGTVLGSAVAVLLMSVIANPFVLALTMIPLSAAAVITRPRSYRLFTFFLTPVFVLFADHTESDLWTGIFRSGAALLGGLIALAASIMVIPSWEKRRLSDAMQRVTVAISRYAKLSFDALEQRSSTARALLPEGRRAVGIALGEAETSLERLLAEPLHGKTEPENAMQFITYVRRLSNAFTTLDATIEYRALSQDKSSIALHAARDYVEDVLDRLSPDRRAIDAESTPRLPRLPDGLPEPLGPGLHRILRYSELVSRLPQAQPETLPPPPFEARARA